MTREKGAESAEQAEKAHVLYRLFDADEKLLYIGVSLNVASRLAQHRPDRPWWDAVATIRLEHFPDRAAVMAAERAAIRDEAPLHNDVHQPRPGRRDKVESGGVDQMNIRVDPVVRAKVRALAKVLGENDDLGTGASAVVRRLIAGYLAEHEDEIPNWWVDHL